ncbi:3-oxoacyl-ACP reductase FabG [Conchiformibius kuhniae]|uniref:3-oxoacyl-[acyl-carrier-protein] reductase n=1 Tax=Conchiformibius kuhniae TaxID=211502 RepID=A0A8T9MUA8_9NEIS|nr:3-oxoacyl-ACP reductase FabG [Conchiformibius kuhniae]UOP05460.1 3-oxoacyl-ACP reductase FabG [Conchiformibius kuhniae]
MTHHLNGKIALVTGASRGIGAAVADTLAQAGATVIGTATTANGAAAISERLAAHQGTGRVLDIGEAQSVENLIAEVEKQYSKIDILVNNAGITRDNLLMRMKEEDWDAVMDVNLKSVFRAAKAVLRGMMKQRAGRIITITSVVGTMGNAGQCNYAAAKAALAGFSKSLAREAGSRGITVNCVAPGFIDTDMTRVLPEETRKMFEAQTALGHFGEAQDIADAVCFLASDQARYITGQTLHVNGGMLMP